jgi:hypothetical protein
MPDLESATIQLYEEASLTEDLIDEEANALMKWAEAQIPVLLEKHPDETAFDEAFKALRTFVKSVNRLIGQGETMDDTEKQERMTKIAEVASAIGYPVTSTQLPSFTAQAAERQPGQNKVEAIESLLNWVTSSQTAKLPEETPALPPSLPAPAEHFRTFKEIRNDEEEPF